MSTYDKSKYYIDFSDNDKLTNDEKIALKAIQDVYRPIERVDYLLDIGPKVKSLMMNSKP